MLRTISQLQYCTRGPKRKSWGGLALLSCTLILSACTQISPKPESNRIEKRLEELEQRVDSLERLYATTASHPLRSREEIEERIQSLEAERTTLLEKYKQAHPYVRDIDLRLRLLRSQLKMLDQTDTTSK